MAFLSKNRFWFLAFFLLFVVRCQISFFEYLSFKNHKFLNVEARVINQYKKEGKNYQILKLKNNSLTFYTTSRENLKNLLNERVKLTIITSKVSFFEYLFTFYAPSFNIKLLSADKIDLFIEKQHSSSVMKNLFKALFLGESIDFSTRQKLSSLGVSHLFALSGLHLGFISFVLYFVFSPLYKIFQKKFPYRNRFFDLGILVLAVEFVYLYFTSFPASLIRAYVLEVLIFIFAMRFKELFSLNILFFTILFSFLIFFSKIFSIGFLLSFLGVFYIYLFFKHVKFSFFSSVFLSFYMFLVMFVWSHYFFGNFNYFQFLSPLVNIIFSFFYPLEIFLHLIGFGGVFDDFILKYLSLGSEFYEVKISFVWVVIFGIMSLLAFFSKYLFYGINLLAFFIVILAI
ncbi:ComEC/Rec2 family competence protein [Caminibacter pacificus]